MFQNAIQDSDIFELEGTMKLYTLAFASNLDFVIYDRSDLRTARNHAMQILNSHSATLAPPALPPSAISNSLPVSPPSASFKPPKLVTDNWSGQSYDFYPWLSSVLKDSPWPIVTTRPRSC